MTRPILLILALLASAFGARADDVDCRRADTQMAMNICAGRDYEAADQKLNEAYRALMQKVDDDLGTRLKAAQRAWIAYRDARCDFDTYATIDGSIHPMMQAQCLETVTREQTQYLSDQLECTAGDLSCGGG